MNSPEQNRHRPLDRALALAWQSWLVALGYSTQREAERAMRVPAVVSRLGGVPVFVLDTEDTRRMGWREWARAMAARTGVEP